MATKKKKQRYLMRELEKMSQANAILRNQVEASQAEAEKLVEDAKEKFEADLKKARAEADALAKELEKARKSATKKAPAKKAVAKKKASKK